MKTVKLTSFECEVILVALNEKKICETQCFCNYKDNLCDKLTESGEPRCKLKRAIQDLEDKLS